MRDNCGDWNGGGISNEYSDPIISNCMFMCNRAVGNDGGGINNQDESNPIISNCIFVGNQAYDWGGAIRSIWVSRPVISNCLMTGNRADEGGAMFYWTVCRAVITNCTMADNTAHNGDTLGCDSQYDRYQNDIQLTNCIISDSGDGIWNDDDSTIAITYSNITDGYPGVGNIDADPCFARRGCWVDANDPDVHVMPDDPNARFVPGDYHLLAVSPCINSGDPAYVPGPNERDIDGQSRVFDGRIDMGADEFVPWVPAALKLTPRKLNPFSKGRWLKAHVVLPEGFEVSDVAADVPLVMKPFEIESDYLRVFLSNEGQVEIEAGFDRTAFCGLPSLSFAEVRVEGMLANGQLFAGADRITLTNNALKCLAVLASYWLDIECAKPDWCGGLDMDQNSTVNFADYAMFGPCCVEITVE
jgi:hypothetical protein